MEKQGASVVISHQVIDGKNNEYETWLNEIIPLSKKAKGNLDWQIIRPIPDLTSTYTVIIRFDSVENLKGWLESNERKSMIEKVVPLLNNGDSYTIKSGLDFLFTTSDEKVKTPPRWKQYLVTWSAIFPLSLTIPLIVLPILRAIGIPQLKAIDSFFVSGTVVMLMIYFIMPNYTKLIKNWLYK